MALLMPASTAWANHGIQVHWGRHQPTTTAVAQVYLEDFTGPAWPVGSMVAAWDNRPAYLRPFYRAANNCNPAVVHCVPVVEINNPNELRGVTTYRIHADGHIVHGSMRVYLNNAYNYTTALRREVTCHELGHAMGPLGENGESTSCMQAGSPYVDNPDGHDYNIIERVYNH